MNHLLIENLNWRYATKRYDSVKRVSTDQIELLKEALRLTPTSYGLQPIKFLFIENPAIRQKLFAYSYNQKSIIEASHLIVICSHTNINEANIDDYMSNTARTRNLSVEQLDGYSNFLKKVINTQTIEEKSIWAQKQAYLALGVLVDACAHLRIDATPIEGFDNKGYDDVLNLNPKGLKSTLVVPIGYRHSDDATQHWKKVRKSTEELFETY